MRGLKWAAGVGATLALAVGSEAGAAVTIGETLTPSSVNGTCNAGPNPSDRVELIQTARADGTSYAAPSDGRLTSWSFRAGTVETVLTLRVYRPTGNPLEYTVIAQDGPLKTVAGDGALHTFPFAGLVKQGDVIGIISNRGECSAFNTGPGDTVAFRSPNATPVGETATYTQSGATVQMDISARFVSDPPQTQITKRPSNRSKRSRARFHFGGNEAGSTFECKLSGPGLRPRLRQFNRCSSPRRYRNLDPGRYSFKVRAVDPEGSTDPTPATDRFRVLD